MNKALLITAFAIVVSSAHAHEPRRPVTNILRIDNEGITGDTTLLVYNVPRHTEKRLIHLNKLKQRQRISYTLYQERNNKILYNYAHTWLKTINVDK